MPLINCLGGSSKGGPPSIEAQYIAGNNLKIGDAVYTIEGDIYSNLTYTNLDNQISSIVFSPDGSKLIVCGYFTGYAKFYSVSGNIITYICDITDNGTALNNSVTAAAFSPDGSLLILGGNFTSNAKKYSISGNTISYQGIIYATGSAQFNSGVACLEFSPDGTKLIIGGYFNGSAKIYTVSGNTVSYVADIKADSGTTALIGSTNDAAFSSDGTKLFLVGSFANYAKLYTVSGTTVTFVSDIKADGGSTALNDVVSEIVLQPGGSVFVIVGQFLGKAKIYTITDTTITYMSDIKNKNGIALDRSVDSIAFSPDGTTLILGGQLTGWASIYSFNNTFITTTYISDIKANIGTTALDGIVTTVSFAPNGKTLVLGGNFTKYAKIYSVSGTTITYSSMAFKYRIPSSGIPLVPNLAKTKIGIVKQNIVEGNTGTVTILKGG